MSRVKAHLSNKTANQPSFSDFMHLQTILLTNHWKGWHSDHTLSSLTETWKSNKNKKSKDKPFSILLRGREEGPLKCSRVVRVYSSLQISSSQGYAQHFVAGTHTQSNLYLKVALNPLSPESDQHQISPRNSNALYNRVVTRIKDMITQDVCVWYFINFSPLRLLEMNRGNKWEFKFWS